MFGEQLEEAIFISGLVQLSTLCFVGWDDGDSGIGGGKVS